MTEYEQAIKDAVSRIDATIIVSGESPEQLKEAIRHRVGDLAKPTAKAFGSIAERREACEVREILERQSERHVLHPNRRDGK